MVAEAACASSLLRPGAGELLRSSHATYPQQYDDVFDEVHLRLESRGSATKLDLAALIAWKHVRNARWMSELLKISSAAVEAATAEAFAPNLSDDRRIAALKPLPGFGRGGAFTSVLLTAWNPTEFGVYDKLVNSKRHAAVTDACICDWSALPTYWAHLRALGQEMTADYAHGNRTWTPRMVEMGLMNL